MMICEFTDRTGYAPEYEEYHYIEESYYEFDGSKDEFCKQWLKGKRSGRWAAELKLRKALDEQKAKYEAIIAEKEDNLAFYRPYFWRANKLRKELEAANEKFERLAQIIGSAAKLLDE